MINSFNALKSHEGFVKYFKNTSWMMGDKIVRMGVGFFVTVWIIRYLGPEQYGLLSYTVAFAFIFQVLSTLGLDSIMVKELVRHPKLSNDILGTAFFLKLFGALVAFILSLLSIVLIRPHETEVFWLTLIAASGFFFHSFNVIDFYFQSKVKSKFTVQASIIAFSVVTLVKIWLLYSKADLMDFALATLLEIALTSVLLVFMYFKNQLNVLKWRYKHKIARILLKQSAPLIFSGIAVMLYMRMDQVMIGEMIGDTEVGYYTAALRISSIWYFIPMMIANSLFPAIIATKKREEAQYMQRIEKLYALMGWMGITVAIVITLSAAWLINLLFGEGYVASANILTIHIWTGIAISMGFVHSKWLVIESFQKYLIIYTSIAAFINIVGNMILIPSYGASGAAVATLLAQFSPIFLQLFIHDVRRNFYLMLASFLFPIKRVLSVI